MMSIHDGNAPGGQADGMFDGPSDSDQKRLIAAIVFLVVGILLILWTWVSWVVRTSPLAGTT